MDRRILRQSYRHLKFYKYCFSIFTKKNFLEIKFKEKIEKKSDEIKQEIVQEFPEIQIIQQPSTSNRHQRLRFQIPKNVVFTQRPGSSDACNVITQYLLKYAIVNSIFYL